VRLIYADWLDEQDDEGGRDRAEFIRVQCALARPAVAPRPALAERQRLLRARRGDEWAGPLLRLTIGYEFHRGFIDVVSVEAGAFPGAADALFGLAPIQHLQLDWGDAPAALRGRLARWLADCPHLARLRSLYLYGSRLGNAGAEALAVSPYLTGLRRLDLSHCDIGDGGVRALAALPGLDRLEALDLSSNAIGAAGIRHLAAALRKRDSGAPCLRELDLRDNPLGRAGLRALRASPLLRRVARL
jgi:hypothetical protein